HERYQLRVDLVRLFATPIAEELVELGKALGVVNAVAFEDDRLCLVGVRVEQLQRAIVRGSGARPQHQQRERDKRHGAQTEAREGRAKSRPPARDLQKVGLLK